MMLRLSHNRVIVLDRQRYLRWISLDISPSPGNSHWADVESEPCRPPFLRPPPLSYRPAWRADRAFGVAGDARARRRGAWRALPLSAHRSRRRRARGPEGCCSKACGASASPASMSPFPTRKPSSLCSTNCRRARPDRCGQHHRGPRRPIDRPQHRHDRLCARVAELVTRLPRMAPVALIGAGGVGKAIAFALAGLGVAELQDLR